jgi:hypothetical protein
VLAAWLSFNSYCCLGCMNGCSPFPAVQPDDVAPGR